MTQKERYTFYMQAAISSTLVLFCMFNLTFHQKGSRGNEALYASLLSGVFGFWLPSPASASKANNIAIESEETNINTGSKNES